MWLTEHRKKLVMRQLVALGMQTLGKCLQTCMCSKKPRESDSWVHMLKTDSVKSLDHTWYKGSKVQFPAYSVGQHPQSDLMESASPQPSSLSFSHTHTHHHDHHHHDHPRQWSFSPAQIHLHSVILATNGDSCPS